MRGRIEGRNGDPLCPNSLAVSDTFTTRLEMKWLWNSTGTLTSRSAPCPACSPPASCSTSEPSLIGAESKYSTTGSESGAQSIPSAALVMPPGGARQ
jgi:hypothetical protein